ncbi:transketolase family protein [candidate division KSB3 bacterium]|uniref:Transketolase family protein n=1 Tax=candidate division KSB3 bacterium TaxID=2044937 RepID=A0A9D5JWD6_9BACT|nr:transketolase family protein [candidate division KSB3 bacterium]MBD3325463.1 transketolase family protein [candidate division KSB3 bacterium]
MTINIAKEHVKEEIMMRDVYCQTLIELAKANEQIVVLDADLMNSMGMMPFLNMFPERTFNCGVQEANMMGIAAGLSIQGKIPYAHTFGPFASRRCFDQVFMSCAYAKANVRIIGSDPGVTAAYNGGTHMPLEDMGIMRNIPEMTVIEPTDCVMLGDMIRQLATRYGMFYIRLLRRFPIKMYDEGSTFDIGKAVKLRDGNDATIFATGIMVDVALRAAQILQEKGISARVLNMFTLKPIDQEAIVTCAKETGAIVTAENHNILNGLGSAVAEVLVEHLPTPMERVGVQDLFGEVGSEDYLRERFRLTPEEIVRKVEKVVSRKNQ